MKIRVICTIADYSRMTSTVHDATSMYACEITAFGAIWSRFRFVVPSSWDVYDLFCHETQGPSATLYILAYLVLPRP